jgi:heme exporter protein D
MNHWAFIMAAYGLTFIATIGLLAHSLRSMHDAEIEAQNDGERN